MRYSLFLLVFLSLISIQSHSQTATSTMLGFYSWEPGGGPGGGINGGPKGLNGRQAWLGRNVMMAQAFGTPTHWMSGDMGWQLDPWRNWIAEKPGRVLHYTPHILLRGETLEKCATGTYNSRFATLANKLVARGFSSLIIRPLHEFNGFWNIWYSVGHEAAFKGCFIQFVTAMRTAQPNNKFKFDWNPLPGTYTSGLEATYPGNAYVDYITTDPYDQPMASNGLPIPLSGCDEACKNTKRKNNWGAMRTYLNVFSAFAKSKGKPIGFSEWGLWPETDHVHGGGGDDTYYIQGMYDYFNNPANNVAFQIYFDISAGDGDHQLYSPPGEPTAFPNAAAKFKALFGAAAAAPAFTFAAASLAPAAPTAGQSVTVTVPVKSSVALIGAKLELIIAQTSAVITTNFSANTTNNVSFVIKLPANIPVGKYDGNLIVKSSASTQLAVKYGAASINVAGGVSAPVSFAFGTTVLNPTTVLKGKPVNINVPITSNTSINNGKFIFYITNSASTSVAYSEIVLSLAAGTKKSAVVNINIPSTLAKGTYQVNFNSYRADGSRLIYKGGLKSFTLP